MDFVFSRGEGGGEDMGTPACTRVGVIVGGTAYEHATIYADGCEP